MENLISKALEKAFEMRQNYVNESPSHIFNCYPYCWGLKVRDFDLFFCLSNVSGKFLFYLDIFNLDCWKWSFSQRLRLSGTSRRKFWFWKLIDLKFNKFKFKSRRAFQNEIFSVFWQFFEQGEFLLCCHWLFIE